MRMTRILAAALAIALMAAALEARAGELDITIEGAKGAAPILGQVFADSLSFTVKQGGVAKFKVDPDNGRAVAVVKDLPPGRYVVALFQDLNGNGKLDANFFGVPTEPYGFSHDVERGIGIPDFDAAAVTLGDAPLTLTIHLQ